MPVAQLLICIYNSRNYKGVLALEIPEDGADVSTIVEIIKAY